MQQALLIVGTNDEIAACVADDARADGGRRMVLLDPRYVTIKRRLQGMKMHLSVPIENYLGVAIASEKRLDGILYRVILAHRDPELCVTLSETGDRRKLRESWRCWAAFFAMPRLIEKAPGEWETDAAPHPCVKARGAPSPRRRKALSKRRLRRTASKASSGAPVHRGEREIISYE